MERKNILSIISLFAIINLMGCKAEEGGNGLAEYEVNASITEISSEYQESSNSFTVTAEHEWTAYSNNDWIICKIADGSKENGQVNVYLKNNYSSSERIGDITLKCGSTRKKITVKQGAAPEEIANPAPHAQLEGYELVWRDEFDDSFISSPDENEWWYEEGDGGWGNNELQYYIPGTKNGVTCAEIKDGTLRIMAKQYGDQTYSIRMNTIDSWKYGYFEARLKMPVGNGTWAAFWMLPKNFTKWPDDGEIDIMENVGHDFQNVAASIHCAAYNHQIGAQRTSGPHWVGNTQYEFHTYSLEWTETMMTFYVDGVPYYWFGNDNDGDRRKWPFDAPFYLKLNLAWGGSWGSTPDYSALPATYEVDYVRVYQKIQTDESVENGEEVDEE